MNRPAETPMDLSPLGLDPRERDFYIHAMQLLHDAGIESLVGGAYSLAQHAGIVRHTKDFDIFLRRRDLEAACRALEKGGYRTELVFPHWLAKAFLPHSDAFVDLIFGSGNGLCTVDDEWFEHAVPRTVFDRPARLVPPEEVIWTKAFVQERERFDGADIAHVLLSRGRELNWPRLLKRFQGHEAVLLAHLILFRYIFPDASGNVPQDVMRRLLDLADKEPPQTGLCRGTLLSRAQYLIDIGERGYSDARMPPIGNMLCDDVAHWTAAIGTIK
jgi:hypothetical protein